MNNNKSYDFFINELDSNIKIIKEKTKSNKFKTGLINGLAIISAGLITLTLGVDVAPESLSIQKNLALFLGFLLTVVNGWGVLFDYKKLWVRQKVTLLNLYQIRNELNFRKSQSAELFIDDLFEQYQQIWEEDREAWKSIVKGSPKQNKNRN